MSYTTTSYGTWTNRVAQYSTGIESDVADYIGGGDADWREMIEKTGAFKAMCEAYREAIDAALPPSVSLCGDEFIGPATPDEGEFDGYPTDENGFLDFETLFEDIDLSAIVERHDLLTLEDIGRDVMKSKAKAPAKAAAAAMSRLGVKPFAYHPHPDSGRPQALYRSGDVDDALASRPGQGTRTDLGAAETV